MEDTENNDSNKTDNDINNLQKCINESCRLLGCNKTALTYKELSSLVKKRSISFSPKNNNNNPRREVLAEQLKELEEVWQLYKTLRPVAVMIKVAVIVNSLERTKQDRN
ncbi:large T antigen [Caerostris darwini]|uniref:Large T antigen n=1 Tax=Caerostris darwini TaxID=1538125 RepID=A0AAV4W343_9ARAC|nr:large T antigen [Caerostris darwini]